MNKNQARAANRLNSTADDAQRALRRLKADTERAISAFEEGQRFPHSPATIGRTASYVVETMAKVEALLEIANASGVPEDVIVEAYKGKHDGHWVGEDA